MKHLSIRCAIGALFLGCGVSHAAELSVSVTNLTQGMYFTPVLAIAHDDSNSLFEVGETASAALQEMAEGGSLAGLAAIGDAIVADYANTEGLTAPGTTQTLMLSTADSNTVLSMVGMILPTNDGFIGLDNWPIPTEAGTYTLYLNAYDAGTEVNDEIRGGGAPGTPGMPVPPPLEDLVGNGGSGVTAVETNTTVHIHRGNLGDSDMVGGSSDINLMTQRWLNPIARVTVVVN
ncbi:spondin domain-containing protein [Aestuariibacter halophilus]|uniref:Spondin domain-containing protein n=1 Tax=Fluctibacter halophilus TaxID=226011 RepID=A0ABS8G9F8_9ALTE|nr:spondin domain-containing protein [Aestuariibacter halophilus]MCC2617207.1 spondin domain-containing protein [Aestuariibacter halophilus]